MRLIDADEVIRQLEAERDLILPSTGQYYHDQFVRNHYNHAIEIVKGAVKDE
jgi:hypothetical protein